MFHRRRHTYNPPGNAPQPTPAAALAASQAFLKNHNSNASLSSAAAAAALRSHATSPTPVANIQTKRMVRRASGSSIGSSVDGSNSHSDPRLRRTPSSGSMSERTFRSNSPSRSSPVVPADVDAPPVPALPMKVKDSKLHRRASSVEPPARISSPEPQRGSGRGMSVDRGSRSKAHPAPRPPPLARVSEGDRSGSQSPVNFSYPRSPTGSPVPPSKGWHTGPLVTGNAPRTELTRPADLLKNQPGPSQNMGGLSQSIHANAEAPVSKKRISSGVEGSHLVSGSMSAKPRGTAVDSRREEQEHSSQFAPSTESRPVTDTRRSEEVHPTQPTQVLGTSENAKSGLSSSKFAQAESQILPPPERETNAPVEPSKHAALEPTSKTTGTGRSARPSSLSPTRSAHFAATTIELANGFKHQPPLRSASPAKSALKHSPSSSIRTASPVAQKTVAVEDFASGDDASKLGSKKKKNVRVSFDEDVISANHDTGAAHSSATEPISNGTRGLGTSRWSSAATEKEPEEIMTPRPALPSFGSIRGRRRSEDDGSMAEKVTETVPSLSASVSTIADPLEPSSDHALGHIISQDIANHKPYHAISLDSSRASLEPIPPEVTTVEGTGYGSDSDQSVEYTPEPPTATKSHDATMVAPVSTPIEPSVPVPVKSAPSKVSQVTASERTPIEADVPSIAILPATPGLEDSVTPSYDMPGGFYDSTDRLANAPAPSEAPPTGSVSVVVKAEPIVPASASDLDSASASASTPLTKNAISGLNAAWKNVVADLSDDLEESSSDGSSIYSDAAEDLSDFEDGGFASLDAIVESPVVASGLALSKHSDQPVRPSLPERLTTVIEQEEPVTPAVEPKEHTVLTSKQMEAKVPSTTHVAPTPATSKQIRTQPKQAPAAAEAESAPRNDKPRSLSMRKSMRAQPEPVAPTPILKKSMRSGSTGSAPQSYGLESSKYSSIPADVEPRGSSRQRGPLQSAMKQRPVSMGSAVLSSKPMNGHTLNRTMSNDSDSESSFKRQRRPRSSGGGMTMRRTMRGATAPSAPAPTMRPTSPESPQSATRGSRFSIRSLSPSSTLGGRSLRQPIPPPNDPGVRTLRGQAPPKKSGFFGKSSKPKAPVPNSKPSRFQSRFADSSDEEDGGRPAFKSRFAADSDSDDDMILPTGLTPVRGIPRRPGDEDRDSTDLSDEESDVEPVPRGTKQVSAPVVATNGHSASTLQHSKTLKDSKYATPVDVLDTPTKEKKKRSFFGFGKKKAAQAPPATTDLQRPSTPSQSQLPSSPSSPSTRSPKLQRRTMPSSSGHRTVSDSWPLQDSAAAPLNATPIRPSTSDGRTTSFAKDTRPKLEKKHFSDLGAASNVGIDPKTGKPVILDRKGKKKKFQGLRRAFGLSD